MDKEWRVMKILGRIVAVTGLAVDEGWLVRAGQ
jgi:hypothetical protein